MNRGFTGKNSANLPVDWKYSGKNSCGAFTREVLGLAGETPRDYLGSAKASGGEVPREAPHSKTHAEEGVSGEHFRVLFLGLLTSPC